MDKHNLPLWQRQKLDRAKRIELIKSWRFKDVAVVLEDIHDPHNAAASFRSLDAFGVENVHLVFEQEEPFNPKKIGKESSSSANKWLNFTIWHSTDECLTFLRKQGYYLLATALSDQAELLPQVDLQQEKIAFLFGNEHRGLSSRALELADKQIIIPIYGFVQSLNLSVSVGIVMYELSRQRYWQSK